MDIIERLVAAIKTEDFWVGDQREDNILKDSKKIIEQLREALRHMLRWHDQLSLADIAKAKAALKEEE